MLNFFFSQNEAAETIPDQSEITKNDQLSLYFMYSTPFYKKIIKPLHSLNNLKSYMTSHEIILQLKAIVETAYNLKLDPASPFSLLLHYISSIQQISDYLLITGYERLILDSMNSDVLLFYQFEAANYISRVLHHYLTDSKTKNNFSKLRNTKLTIFSLRLLQNRYCVHCKTSNFYTSEYSLRDYIKHNVIMESTLGRCPATNVTPYVMETLLENNTNFEKLLRALKPNNFLCPVCNRKNLLIEKDFAIFHVCNHIICLLCAETRFYPGNINKT